jgi:hypothetical protein
MADPICVERVRARVATAHGLVAAGRYEGAIAMFAGALDELRRLLGDRHPEVEELASDLEAARQMAEVHAFGREAGLRHWDAPAAHEPAPGLRGSRDVE